MINLNLPPMDTYWVSPTEREYFIVHWGDGFTPTTVAAEANTVRAYDDYHRNTQGWGGIGYNLCIGPATGEVYMGRGLNAVGAHSPSRNYNGIGVCVLGSPTVITDAIKRGLREAYRIACQHTGKKLQINVHRNSPGNSTTCPGDALTEWVMAGGITSPETQKTPTKRKGKQKMLFIKLNGFSTGKYAPGTDPLFAIWDGGNFLRFTGVAQSKILEKTHGIEFADVSESFWDAVAATAMHGSNNVGYRNESDANLARIAAGVEQLIGETHNG